MIKFALQGITTPLQPHQQSALDKAMQQERTRLILSHQLGSGKTLTSLAIANALGKPTDVIVPASLVGNYLKEIQKHTTPQSVPFDVMSLQQVIKNPPELPKDERTLIIDEAHRLRTPSSKSYQVISRAPHINKILLTGTPIYNSPADLANLIYMIDPGGPSETPEHETFRRANINKYLTQTLEDIARTAKPDPYMKNPIRNSMKWQTPIKGFDVAAEHLGKMPHIRRLYPDYDTLLQKYYEIFPNVENHDIDEFSQFMAREQDREKIISRHQEPYDLTREMLKEKTQKFVHTYQEEKQNENFPSKTTNIVEVPMSPKQFGAYTKYFQKLPKSYQDRMLSSKVEKLPPGAAQNPFLVYTREIANTYAGESPKIDKMVSDIKKEKGKTIVYSNFLETGLYEVGKRLEQEGIPYSYFTGKEKNRDQIVKDYNTGKIKVMLLSSAGGEGLDLKETKQVQIMEPHWNNPKIDQVIGRAARYKSHAELPKNERNVKINYYVSTTPNTAVPSIDKYMRNISEHKMELGSEFI